MSQVENEKVKSKKSGNSKNKKTSELNKTEDVQVNKVVETPVVTEVVSEVSKPVETTVQVEEENNVVVDVSIENKQLASSEESSSEILFNKLINQFQDVQLVMKTLHSNLRILQKEVLRERKESKKRESKIKKKSDKKKNPSGFAKPSPITNELANFLGIGIQLEPLTGFTF
jgi:hypothetical protein